MDTRIAMMTNHSLFADRLISRLREYPEKLNLQVFDFSQPDVISHIVAFKPVVIILQENEGQQLDAGSLMQIFAILPNLLLVYLYLNQPEIQIIQSERCTANGVGQLVEIIRQSNNMVRQFSRTPTQQFIVEQSQAQGSGDKL